MAEDTEEQFWDARYGERDHIWSGEPNAALVGQLTELAPGRALDLGCGEGADAVWLAQRGWRVTAVDISGVALARARDHAATAGVADRIDFQQHNLATSFPEGEFDLVSTQFLHSRDDRAPREKILRAAAAAVAPGGVLLVEGHSGLPSWEQPPEFDVHLPSPQEVVESLDLSPEWEVLVCEEHERTQLDHEGRSRSRTDSTVKARRAA